MICFLTKDKYAPEAPTIGSPRGLRRQPLPFRGWGLFSLEVPAVSTAALPEFRRVVAAATIAPPAPPPILVASSMATHGVTSKKADVFSRPQAHPKACESRSLPVGPVVLHEQLLRGCCAMKRPGECKGPLRGVPQCFQGTWDHRNRPALERIDDALAPWWVVGRHGPGLTALEGWGAPRNFSCFPLGKQIVFHQALQYRVSSYCGAAVLSRNKRWRHSTEKVFPVKGALRSVSWRFP